MSYWECPKCGSANLSVDVVVQVRLRQYEDNFETEDVGNNHEWGHASTMYCRECGHVGDAGQFDTENEDEQD